MINFKNKKIILYIMCGCYQVTNNIGLPPMGFVGPSMTAPRFEPPSMMRTPEPYNSGGMRPIPIINNANQFEQKNNAAPNTTTILWSQEQNRTNNTIRYNWYFRQKTTRDTYYVYEQMSVIIDEIEQFISDLTNKINDIKSTMSEYSGKIKVVIQAYRNNLHDINQLLPICTECIQELNLLNSDDFATHNKEFKADVAKAIYDTENTQIIIHGIESDMKLINSALQQIYATSRMVQEQKNYVQSLESTSWDNYQKLDELISDAQVRSISSEISNALDNAKQVKAFLESEVIEFVSSTTSNITHALNTTHSNVQNVIKELSLIQKKIEELKTLKKQELLKKHQQDELERAEKEVKEEIEKKAQEELKKKKMLLARPWYQKIYQDKIKGFFHAIGEYQFSNLYFVPLSVLKELSQKPAILIQKPFILIKDFGLDMYHWVGKLIDSLLGNEKNNQKNKKKIIVDENESEQKQEESKDLVDELQKQSVTKQKNPLHVPLLAPENTITHNAMIPIHQEFPAPLNHPGMPLPRAPLANHGMPPISMRPGMPINNINARNRRGMGAHPQMISNTSQGPAAMTVMDIQAEQKNQQNIARKEQIEKSQEFQKQNIERQNEARQVQIEKTPMMSTEPMNNNRFASQDEFGRPNEMNNFEEAPEEFGGYNRENNQQQDDNQVAMTSDREQPFEQSDNGSSGEFNNNFQQPYEQQADGQGTIGNFDDNLLNISGEAPIGQDMNENEQADFN